MNEQFTLFWGGPFSQWYKSSMDIFFWGSMQTFNCCEQYMMACKALMFHDTEILKKILETSDPREQKKLGRQVKNFDVVRWEEVAKEIVYAGNWEKFNSNKGLKKMLLDTAGTTLVEASPYDKIWGIGLSENDPKARQRKFWQGTNWLGEILTEVREDIVAGEKWHTKKGRVLNSMTTQHLLSWLDLARKFGGEYSRGKDFNFSTEEIKAVLDTRENVARKGDDK